MEFFLLLITLQLFINLFFISRSQSNLKQDKLLKLYVFIAGISVFSKFLLLVNESSPNLLGTLSSTFAFVALSHLYIRCVVRKQTISNSTLFFHMMPFLFSIVLFLSEMIIVLFISDLKDHDVVAQMSRTALIARCVLPAVYLMADIYYILKSPDRKCYFSFKTDNILVGIFMINKLVILIVIVGSLYHLNALSFLAFLLNVIISSIIMYYKVFVPYQDKISEQQQLLKELIFTRESKEAKVKYSKVEYDDKKLMAFVSTIESYLENGKPYLDMDLSFDELSEATQINKHDLSYVLNQHLNTNFYQLVNLKRIDHFLEHIQEIETEGKSILALAFESGFSSKSTFNKYFRMHTGMSPSEYLKNKADIAVEIS